MGEPKCCEVLDLWVIEFRPWNRDPMTPGELARFDQLCAAGDLEETGSWLLGRGFEFRVDLGTHWLHVQPA